MLTLGSRRLRYLGRWALVGLMTVALLFGQTRSALAAIVSSTPVGTGGIGITSLSWSHTVPAGSNRLLLVRVGNINSNVTVTSVTFGGVALTALATATDRSSTTAARVSMYYLVAPAVTTATVTVNFSGSTRAVAGSVDYSGVSQATPLGTPVIASGSSAAPSVTATGGVAGDEYADAVAMQGNGGTAQSVGPSQVDAAYGSTGTTTADALVMVSAAPGGASTTMSWTTSGSAPWVAMAVAVKAAVSYTITGKVFEDVNYGGGAGRSLAGASGTVRAGATVELYNAAGTYLSSTTTDAAGGYSFTVTAAANYHVRVVNSTVTSSRTGATAALRAVQTFATDASSGSAVAMTHMVGGTNPALVDPGAAGAGAAFNPATGVFSAGLSGTAQSYTVVAATAGSVSGVDFGFNFSTIVNTNDSGQGSLRQFVTNAAALGGQSSLAQSGFRRTGADVLEALPSGVETSIFMIPNGTAVPGIAATVASQLTGGVAVITLASVLPNLPTSRVSLDGTTQSANVGNANAGYLGTGGTVGVDGVALAQVPVPEVQLTGPGGTYGFWMNGSTQTVRGFALRRFLYDIYIYGSGSGNTVEWNVLGTNATAFADPGASLRSDRGVYLSTHTNVAIRHNLVGWHNNYGILLDGSPAGFTITANESRGNGQTDGFADGITTWPASAGSITANLVAGNGGHGIDLFAGSASITVTNNTATGNGMRAADNNGIRIDGSNNTIDRNVVSGNYRSGITVSTGTRNKITRNAVSANGGVVASISGTAASTGLGIDLDGNETVNANEGTVNSGQVNYGLDTPVITSASYAGGVLTVSGYVGNAAGQAAFANVTVEVFKSSNDASGFGEGQVYLGSVTTTSSNGNFTGTITTALVSIGDSVTGTATDSLNNTSEFGANRTVTAQVSGTVFEDLNYGGGAGRSLAASGGAGVAGATVELYAPGSGLVATTTTDSAGNYTFPGVGNGGYFVRVVPGTVRSTRSGSVAGLLPVQTWRYEASWQTPAAVTNEVGGARPDTADSAAATALAWVNCASESGGSSNPCSFTGTRLVRFGSGSGWTVRVATGGVTCSTAVFGDPTPGFAKTCDVLTPHLHSASSVQVAGGSVSGVDFGFNFDTVTNINDSGQGSLRQAITNANTLSGDNLLAQSGRTAAVEHLVFMIPNGATANGNTATGGKLALSGGLRSGLNAFSGGAATITLASGLPTLGAALVVDAQTQPGWTATPVLVVDGNTVSANGVTVGAAAGGSTVSGLVIRRFTGQGVAILSGAAGVTITGNYIGRLNAAGTDAGAAYANTVNGIDVVGSGAIIGGNSAALRNVIAGNSAMGIRIAGNNATVRGNYVGVDATGSTKLANGGYGIDVTPNVLNALVGGAGTNEGNVVSGNSNAGVIYEVGSTGSIKGNRLGTDAAGTSSIAGIGAAVWVSAANVVVGGSEANAGNIISGSSTAGVVVAGSTTNGVTISSNSIFGNAGLGIDLALDGVTVNDGAKTTGQPNLLMDQPVLTTASLNGSTLTVTGYVGSAANQTTFGASRVEVFVSDGTKTNGQGKTYLGAVVADANGNFGGSFTGVTGLTVGTSLVTATATDGSGNTSEFAVNATVTASTIGGTVFEDLNYGGGAGRSLAASGGAGVSGATVELYSASSGTLVASTTTAANGSYSFTGVAAGGYFIRVVQGTVRSTRAGSIAGLVPVQTWRYEASWQLPAAVTNEVGGARPEVADSAAAPTLAWTACAVENATCSFTGTRLVRYGAGTGGWTTRVLTDGTPCTNGVFGDPLYGTVKACEVLQTNLHSASSVHVLAGSNATGVDFGFNFDTVTNTNDSGQGSLRQAITNANTLSGDNLLAQAGRTAAIENLVFMISNGSAAAGLRAGINFLATSAGSYNVATISPLSALPAVSTAMVIDAQTQPGWSAAPLVELNGSGGANSGLTLGANGIVVRGFVINRFPQSGLFLAANGMTLQGNWIGTDASGTTAQGNAQVGIAVNGSGHLIGGSTAAQRNVVSGNGNHGLLLAAGLGAAGNSVVSGNYIGTTATGLAALGNGQFGVVLQTTGNTVGGSSTGTGNVISANGSTGVVVQAAGNSVLGNLIGTDRLGSTARGNGGAGVYVDTAGTAAVIGGSGTARNVIAGNSVGGIWQFSSGGSFKGNYIGIAADGNTAMPNAQFYGMEVYGAGSNQIGGPVSGEGNVISGASTAGKGGVWLASPNNVVQGNRIGTNAAGTAAVANAADGITLNSAATGTLIGGSVAGAGNQISGNGGAGINSSATGTTVQGNLIGTNADGSGAIRNVTSGIILNAGGAVVGGADVLMRNVISGNGAAGIQAFGSGATIQGNRIGTTADGNSALGNTGLFGIELIGGGATVGGAASGAGNVVSGQSGAFKGGIYIASSNNTVQGNKIGTNAAGTAAIANNHWGVQIVGTGSTGNLVGGTASGAGNVIAYNTSGGVAVVGSNATGNAVTRNSIFGNGSIGIDIAAYGRTANDGAKDTTVGNAGMDTPVITSATLTGTSLSVAGYVGSAAGQAAFAGATVEIFAATDDGSGYGQGSAWLGTLVADGSGNFSGSLSVTLNQLRIGSKLTATATDGSSNTSEFGPNFGNLRVNFVVNSNLDETDSSVGDGSCLTASGVCTLRAAITELNAWATLPGTPSIVFAIPGCTATGAAACTLTPATALPSVTRAMVIDASTQTGTRSVASACAPIVEVDGSGAPASSSGLVIAADGSTLRGLSIGGFGQSGISIGANNAAIECNHLGLRADGSTVRRNGAAGSATAGVFVNSGTGIVIGGSTAAQRNVLSGNGGSGAWVNGGTVTIQGNYAGTDATGLAARSNGRWGLHLEGGANHVVGGAGGTLGNLISGNVGFETGGLYLRASGVTVFGNIIGLNATRSATLPNGDASSAYASGIDVRGGSGHVIGGTGSGEANVIAGNQGHGIRVTAQTTRISGNSIYNNLWLGIDLNADGVSANDGATNGAAPNNGMDYPVLTSAGIASPATSMTVSGYVGTGSGQAVFAGARIEFFKAAADSSGYGEGQTYLGFLTADANGRFTGTINFAAGLVAVGDAITATATDAAGNTSEFGPNWTSTTIAGLAPAGFNAFDTDAASTALSGVIRSRTAGSASNFAVIALDSSGTGLHPGFTGSVTLRWLDARNDSGAATGSCRASWVDLGAAGTASFSANARVTVSLAPPATATRSMRLQMSYAGPSGTITSCSNDAFAALPATLAWLGASDTDASTAGTVRTLGNVSASGGVVHRAGRPFTLRAEARDATGALMTGYDGTPTLAVTGCVLPAGCTAGALSATATTAVAGAWVNSSVSYAEVGAISVGLTDAGYAAVDAADTTLAARTIASANLSVGRFVPDGYTVSISTNGQLATANAACLASGSGATFLGQGFGWATAPQVTLTARNAAGGTTALWTGALMKLSPGSGLAASLAASGAGAATVAASYGAFAVSDLGAGQVRVAASSIDRFVLDLPTGAVQPSVTPSWAWALAVSDASEAAVSGNPTLTASATQSGLGFDQGGVFHSGRLALAPGYGDARAGVRLVAQLQRYTSAGWVTMTEDQGCVTVQPQNLGVALPSGVFSTSGVCAAPLTAAATTRGGRAWLTLPATPAAAPGRLQMQLAGSAATGNACSSAGAVQAVVPLGLPWLLGGSGGAGPQALGTWGTTQRDTVLRRETW